MANASQIGSPGARARTEEGPQIFPIQAEGMTLDLDGNRLVDCITLSIGPDPLSVVMGPNGAGKSLVLRLLHGLIAPTSGRILFNGEPISPRVRSAQAMVFQRPVLLRRSVGANMDFALNLQRTRDRADRDALLDRVGLSHCTNRPARQLSGGEQQRLALARALATNPKILFLDEPTANLDPASTQLIEEIVMEVQGQGCKAIFVTHDHRQAKRLAGEVIFINKGRLEEKTPASEFFTSPTTKAAADYLDGRFVL